MSIQIVYIGAKWCGTCKTLKPAVEQLAQRYGVALKVLDYDVDLDDSEQELITKIPTISVVKQDRRMAEWYTNQIANLEKWLTANITLATTDDF